jgi:hypothetical protein
MLSFVNDGDGQAIATTDCCPALLRASSSENALR